MERKQTHIMYGVITALIMVIINALMAVMKWNLDPKMAYVGFVAYAVFLVGIIMNGMAYSKANNADVTFAQTFSSCFKATAVVAIICTGWAILSLFIFPNMQADLMEMTRKKMLEQKEVTEEQVEMTMGMMKKMFKVTLIAGSVFGTMFMGALFSLIAAAVAKKNPQPIYEG